MTGFLENDATRGRSRPSAVPRKRTAMFRYSARMQPRAYCLFALALGSVLCVSMKSPTQSGAASPRMLDRLTKGASISIERMPSGLHRVLLMDVPVGAVVHEVGTDWFSYQDSIGTITSVPQTAISSIGALPRMKK